MKNKICFITLAIFAVIVGVMPFAYYANNIDFGFINHKDVNVLSNTFWKVGLHIHIVFGAIALLLGWMQFISVFRNNKLTFHRNIGKIYFISALISATASIFISFYATGGTIPILGFLLLGIFWFYSTFMGFYYIKCEEFELHQKMMIYSYAACFSAVTLRLWLPLLLIPIKDYNTAYSIVAWLCWIPNLSFAYLIIQKTNTETN